jgi:hypothetical protein
VHAFAQVEHEIGTASLGEPAHVVLDGKLLGDVAITSKMRATSFTAFITPAMSSAVQSSAPGS